MENTVYMPATGYPMADMQNAITETILNLNDALGGLHRADEAMFRMFELAFPHATEAELEDFTKVQGAMRCINSLVRRNPQTFGLWVEEQNSYKPDYGSAVLQE